MTFMQRRSVLAGKTVLWHEFGQPDAPVMVLLHGGHGNWRHWCANIAVLGRHFRLLLPDMPGFGGSDSLSDPSSGEIARHLQAGLDKLIAPEQDYVLACFSFGGLIGCRLALQDPRAKRVILCGSGGQGAGRQLVDVALRSWRGFLQAGDSAALAEALRHNLLITMLHDPSRADSRALAVYQEGLVQARFNSRSMSAAESVAALAADLARPVLLLWGAEDADGAAARAFFARYPACETMETHVIADAGHWVIYEQSDICNTTILYWLGIDQCPAKPDQEEG